MDLLRIGLATIVSVGLPVMALLFFNAREKRRKAATPDFRKYERIRAHRIASQFGGGAIIRIVGFVAGLVATMPVIVGAITILNRRQEFSDAAVWATWSLWFLGGWTVFAWCNRITDALDD